MGTLLAIMLIVMLEALYVAAILSVIAFCIGTLYLVVMGAILMIKHWKISLSVIGGLWLIGLIQAALMGS